MRFHSLTKVLSFPLLAIAIFIFYINYDRPFEDKGYIFIPVVLLVVLYVFNGPIDHWWRTKYPVKFDEKLDEWLVRFFRPYNQMPEEIKTKFQNRLTIYMDARLFQSVGSEMKDVPHDIKCMVSAHGVYMTLQQDDYLIGDTDRIFLYKHPFPSPNHPFLHNVEYNAEDGVIILSLEQLSNAILQPETYYNIAYHAYAEAFLNNTKQLITVDVQDSWSQIETISGWSQEQIQAQTGFSQLELLPVHITLYFSMPQQYQQELPNQYEQWKLIFNTIHESWK